MKDKIKNLLIPLVLVVLLKLITYDFGLSLIYSAEINPHLGILFISGLFFGPIGCLGAGLGCLIGDFIRGYSPFVVLSSALISYLVAYLGYKLWYTRNPEHFFLTKPRLFNTSNLINLLWIISVCAFIYSLLKMHILVLTGYESLVLTSGIYYFINFLNFSVLFSIIFLIINRFTDFSYTPTVSKRKYSMRYKYSEIFLLGVILICMCLNMLSITNLEIDLIEGFLIVCLLIVYIRRPITHVNKISYIPIPEKVMNTFLLLLLMFVILVYTLFSSNTISWVLHLINHISGEHLLLNTIILMDVLLIVVYAPNLIILRYIENRVINPILSFSKIKENIRQDKKIDTKNLLKIYSEYTGQDDEIGILSRTYSDLIINNNEYIENLQALEMEKQLIKAELTIAHNIQEAILPKQSINDKYIMVNGYSKPAKEVGGDFFDFYELDEENTVIIIGDASGKGIPASIYTLLTQNSIKLLIKQEFDPSKILFEINNMTCANNPEMMFITLFLGIYNKKSHILTYVNAGHNPPIIKNNNGYEFLDIDPEIVIGVIEDYEYNNYTVKIEDELLLYTDGITDAINRKQEIYGEEKLINFLNNQTSSDNIISNLMNDINDFSKNTEQFDDMTLLVLKVKQ